VFTHARTSAASSLRQRFFWKKPRTYSVSMQAKTNPDAKRIDSDQQDDMPE
jgi:hypothetical protein